MLRMAIRFPVMMINFVFVNRSNTVLSGYNLLRKHNALVG